MLRPFRAGDLAAVPQDWKINGPDFIGIGVQKAGTSWWHSLLLQHPQIKHNRLKVKELHYFPHFLYNDLSEEAISLYQQAFAAPAGNISGEWSPLYFFHPFCLEHVAKAAPRAKILLLLRNPIDRFFSGLNHFQRARLEKMKWSSNERYFYWIFSLYPEAVYLSLYAAGLRKLARLFDPSKLLILQYEKCKRDPAGQIARTYRFLGVDDGHTPVDISRQVNKKEHTLERLTAEQRRALADYFAEDVRETQSTWPELDLSLWPDFQ